MDLYVLNRQSSKRIESFQKQLLNRKVQPLDWIHQKVLLDLYQMGGVIELRNQEWSLNQSFSWIAIDNPGGHYAKPAHEDFTSAFKTTMKPLEIEKK